MEGTVMTDEESKKKTSIDAVLTVMQAEQMKHAPTVGDTWPKLVIKAHEYVSKEPGWVFGQDMSRTFSKACAKFGKDYLALLWELHAQFGTYHFGGQGTRQAVFSRWLQEAMLKNIREFSPNDPDRVIQESLIGEMKMLVTSKTRELKGPSARPPKFY